MGKAREADTHCSSPRLSCLHSRSGCHTSSGLECSCYSRSGIHEVRRSFHLFHQEQTNTKMKMASKSMNINTLLAIIFSRCNHCFLRVSLNNSDSQFKTQNSLQRLMRCKMKYLPVLPIILESLWHRVTLNFLQENIQENFRTQQMPKRKIFVLLLKNQNFLGWNFQCCHSFSKSPLTIPQARFDESKVNMECWWRQQMLFVHFLGISRSPHVKALLFFSENDPKLWLKSIIPAKMSSLIIGIGLQQQNVTPDIQ